MGGIIELIGRFFLFIIELVVDIICICLWAASAAAVWRIPSWPLEIRVSSRSDFRQTALLLFGAALWDIITLPFAAVTLFSWRMIPFSYAFSEVASSRFTAKEYFWEGRLISWQNFLYLLLDIPFIVMLGIIHVCFWRIPFYYRDAYNETVKNGSAYLAWCGQGKTRRDFESGFETKHRELILLHCLEGLFELLCLPIIVVLLITVYRLPNVKRIMEDDRKSALEKKGSVFVEFCKILLDLPFFILGVLSCLMLIRAKYVFEDIARTTKPAKRRLATALNFLFSFRDWFCVVLMIPLIATVYRAVIAIKSIWNKISPWAPVTPALRDCTLALSAPSNRSTGLVLHVKGSKDADFALSADETVRLFIRNPRSFWPEVGSAFGSAAASVGELMLPATITPRFLDPAVIKKGDTEVDFVIDVVVSRRTASIEKALAKLASRGASRALLHLEYGNATGTLFAADLTPGMSLEATTVTAVNLEDALATGRADNPEGARFGDVFWRIVLMQFALLLADLFALVCFVLLHVIPPRVFRVYTRAAEPTERKRAREYVKELEALRWSLGRATVVVSETIICTEKEMRRAQSQRVTLHNRRRQWDDGARIDGTIGWYDSMQPYTDEFERPGEKRINALLKLDKTYAAEAARDAMEAVRDVLVDYFKVVTALHPEVRVHEPKHFAVNKPGDFFVRSADPEELLARATNVVDRFRSLMDDHNSGEGTAGQAGQTESTVISTEAGDPTNIPARMKEHLDGHLANVAQLLEDAREDYRRQNMCGGKDGWSEVRSTIFREVAQTMYDVVAIIAGIVVVATLYRILPFILAVMHRRPTEGVRIKALQQVAEMAIDFIYLLKVILIFAGIRGIVSLPADIGTYLIAAPSMAVYRRIVDHHFQRLIADIMSIITLVLAWDAIRLTVATVVFGAFAPGVMLEFAVTEWEESSSSSSAGPPYGVRSTAAGGGRQGAVTIESNVCRAGMLLLVSLAWMYGLPVFLGYYVGRDRAALDSVPIAYFAVMLFFCCLSLLFALVYRDRRIVSLCRGAVRTVQPTLANVLGYFGVLLEGVLLVAAAVLPVDAGRRTLTGDSGDGISDAAHYVFLEFGQSWTRFGLPFGVYFSVVVMCLHFVVAAMPIVCGKMLKLRNANTLTQSTAWVMSLQVLGQFLLLIVTRNVASLLTCADSAAGATVLASEGQMACYEGPHLHLAVFAMIMFTYYLPSSVMRNSTYDDGSCAQLDVVWTQLYRLLTNLLAATAIVVITVAYRSPPAGLALLIMASAASCLLTVFYPVVFRPEEGEVCTVRALRVYRGFSYATVAVVACVFAASYAQESDGYYAGYVTVAIAAAAFVAATVVNVLERRKWDVSAPEECRAALLAAARDLSERHMLVGRWPLVERRWRRNVAGSVRASTFAIAALELERHVPFGRLPPLFVKNRGKWVADVDVLIRPCDREDFIDIRDHVLGSRWYVDICPCECCSHWDHEDTDLPDIRDEAADLEEAIRLATTLCNVARGQDMPASVTVPNEEAAPESGVMSVLAKFARHMKSIAAGSPHNNAVPASNGPQADVEGVPATTPDRVTPIEDGDTTPGRQFSAI